LDIAPAIGLCCVALDVIEDPVDIDDIEDSVFIIITRFSPILYTVGYPALPRSEPTIRRASR
jgi:hypothetical protein